MLKQGSGLEARLMAYAMPVIQSLVALLVDGLYFGVSAGPCND